MLKIAHKTSAGDFCDIAVNFMPTTYYTFNNILEVSPSKVKLIAKWAELTKKWSLAGISKIKHCQEKTVVYTVFCLSCTGKG